MSDGLNSRKLRTLKSQQRLINYKTRLNHKNFYRQFHQHIFEKRNKTLRRFLSLNFSTKKIILHLQKNEYTSWLTKVHNIHYHVTLNILVNPWNILPKPTNIFWVGWSCLSFALNKMTKWLLNPELGDCSLSIWW